MVTALVADGNLAFAADRELVDAWLAAFESWATVDRIEPAPLAIARALRGHPAGDYLVDGDGDDAGLVRLGPGRLESARRLPAGTSVPDAIAVPSVLGLPPRFAAAAGALGRPEGGAHEMLAPDVDTRMAPPETSGPPRAWWRWSSPWRSRLERRPVPRADARCSRRRAAALAQSSAPADGRCAPCSPGSPRATLVNRSGTRPTRWAPRPRSAWRCRDAVVRGTQASGDEWQVDGTVGVPPRSFPSLTATDTSTASFPPPARFRGQPVPETFSIAFRYRRRRPERRTMAVGATVSRSRQWPCSSCFRLPLERREAVICDRRAAGAVVRHRRAKPRSARSS